MLVHTLPDYREDDITLDETSFMVANGLDANKFTRQSAVKFSRVIRANNPSSLPPFCQAIIRVLLSTTRLLNLS